MNKKIILIILSTFFIFFTRPRYGGILNLYLNEPISIVPYETGIEDFNFLPLLWENFLILKKNMSLNSSIFKNWSSQNDFKRWEFRIKESLFFSDLTPIESSVLKKSLETYIKSGTPGAEKLAAKISGGNEFLQNKSLKIKGIIDEEPLKLVIDLINSEPDFPLMLSTPYLFVFSERKNSYSGPFVLDSWVKGERIELLPNQNYFKGMPYIEKLQIFFSGKENPEITFDFYKVENNLNESHELIEGKNRMVYLLFNPSQMNENSRKAFVSLILTKWRNKNNRIKLASCFFPEKEVGFVLDFPGIKDFRAYLPYLDINLGIEKELEFMQKDLENVFKEELKINLFYFSSKEKKKIIEDGSFQILLVEEMFFPYQEDGERLIYLLDDVLYSTLDADYIEVFNVLKDREKISDINVKKELFFFSQKKLIEKAIIIPLFYFKENFSFNKKFEGLEVDVYGRPLFSSVRKRFPS
ncbi:MAG: ABC transporter substrate-binding protein [Acidobacteriota bacterium]